MTSSAHDAGSSDFEALARQYFGAWGDALRHASTPGAPAGDDPGSWQRLKLQIGSQSVLRLPRSAVIWRGEVSAVWQQLPEGVVLQQVRLQRGRTTVFCESELLGATSGKLIARSVLTYNVSTPRH